jgi:hypothetical protein
MVLVQADFDAGHEVLVVVLQPDDSRSGCPDCLGSSVVIETAVDFCVLCATSMSLRGKPSNVVREVVILTPC